MKIYITGANGFLGHSFKDYYHDHTLYCHRRGESVTSDLNIFEPDLILHCAGEIYNPEHMFSTNIAIMITHYFATHVGKVLLAI